MGKLTGKVVLVTGGGSGIGLAAAKGFLEEGARVAITGRNVQKLQEAAKSMGSGNRLFHYPADLTEPKQVKTLVEKVTERFGPIDILVNNAGLNIKERGIRDLNPERWQLLVRGNLDSAYYCIYEVLPHMLKRKNGLIINISSTSGKRAGPLGGAAYAAAKFGMAALGICLAAEEIESGIRVSNIFPGEVDTPILVNRPTPVSDEHRRRILKPEDVAAAILFVATLPPGVSVPELVIKPTSQMYV
jgi:NAD(P)-dependent dehydrogenase (short-subunit alcohol dehydrogenase family)